MKSSFPLAALAAAIALLGAPRSAFAHCDTLNGPVVATARLALEKGDVTPVLKWVKPDAEPEIRTAFAQTLAVRTQSREAAALADRYFFETLVRVHRAGEGAPFTGLKSGETVDPEIEAADRALETGQSAELVRHVSHRLEERLLALYQRVLETRKHADHSVAAGREYVEAYVTFVHFYENVAGLAAAPAAGEPGAHRH